jgi:hypothetical protein
MHHIVRRIGATTPAPALTFVSFFDNVVRTNRPDHTVSPHLNVFWTAGREPLGVSAPSKAKRIKCDWDVVQYVRSVAAMGWGAIGNPKNAIITKSTETL